MKQIGAAGGPEAAGRAPGTLLLVERQGTPEMIERLEFVERLRSCLGGRSARQLAAEAGIPAGTLANILRGRSDPARALAVKLARTLRVPVGWLTAGETPDDAVLAQHLRRVIGAERERMVPPVGTLVLERGGHTLRIASRRLSDALAFRAEWLSHALGLDPLRMAVLEVEGEALNPRGRQGDLVLVDLRVDQLGDSGYYALGTESGELVIRRIDRQVKAVLVTSGDASYREVIGLEEASALPVAGRAVAVLARL